MKGQAIYDIMQGIDYDIQSYLIEARKERMKRCGMEK